MTNKTVDLKDEIQSYKFEFGLLKKVPCTKEENAEYLGKCLQLYVCDKALAALYSLDRIFVYVDADKLHFIREGSL